jgi:hypothetical protein
VLSFLSAAAVTPKAVPHSSEAPSELGALPLWLKLARSGLEACRNHEKCIQNQESFAPTRLIRVEEHPSSPVRICHHTVLNAHPPYAALSYVWGSTQEHVLTQETLHAKSASVDQDKLPQTIRDAIEVTRALGLLYLWVDSLCIIQDSDSDKMAQLPQMGRIYRNAAVTIVAASASSALQGFLKAPQPPGYFVPPTTVTLQDADGSQKELMLGYRSLYKASEDPVNGRAWTLQERALSTRVLLFAYDGPKWICQATTINPSSPSVQPSASLSTVRLGVADDFESAEEFSAYSRESWNNLRAEYSERKLTVASDKLPAIQGIATELARETGWHYVQGLWREYLFLDLLWRRNPLGTPVVDDGILKNPPLPRVNGGCGTAGPPTWSWASVQSPVHGIEDLDDPPAEFRFRIIDCADAGHGLGPSPAPPRLVVEGLSVELSWKAAAADDIHLDGWLTVPDEALPEGFSESIIGEATLDVSDVGFSTGRSVLCLAMALVKYENRELKPVEGMLLTPCETCNGGGGFHRVGLFRLYSWMFFKTAEKEILTIY